MAHEPDIEPDLTELFHEDPTVGISREWHIWEQTRKEIGQRTREHRISKTPLPHLPGEMLVPEKEPH